MNLVFLGVPGAGKGTQAVRLAQRLDVPHISTGDMLRKIVKEDTPLAQEVKNCLDAGSLIPDKAMNEAVRQRLSRPDVNKGFILDGYPRTVIQADSLEKFLACDNKKALDMVLYFNLTEEIAVKRLSGRQTCKNCHINYHLTFDPPGEKNICDKCGGELYQRDDDKPEVIRNRFKVYQEKTADLIEYYKSKQLLKEIDASPDPESIFSSMLEILNLRK